MDKAQDGKIGSGTSFIIRSAKKLLLNIAEDAEVGDNSDDDDNEMVERLPLRKLSRPIGYLTSLHFDINSTPFEKKRAHLIIITIVEAFS